MLTIKKKKNYIPIYLSLIKTQTLNFDKVQNTKSEKLKGTCHLIHAV